MGIHDGHRNRLRESFSNNGLDSFNDINALELLLFYAVPRKDTNELAHRLLEHFGSLSEVFNASEKELMCVSGISYNTAVLITLIPQLMKKVEISKTSELKIIECSSDAVEYLRPRFINERDEKLLMLCLDNRNNIISCIEVARGSVNTVDANVRRIVELALKQKAVTVILSHNHPGGTPMPSREDDFVTQCVFQALRYVGIHLRDHIILSDNDYVSLKDAGAMRLL